MIAASSASREAADREAGSAAVSCLHENMKTLLPASQANGPDVQSRGERQAVCCALGSLDLHGPNIFDTDTNEVAQAGTSPLPTLDLTASTTAVKLLKARLPLQQLPVEEPAGQDFCSISDGRSKDKK